jgi:hypothetical protein
MLAPLTDANTFGCGMQNADPDQRISGSNRHSYRLTVNVAIAINALLIDNSISFS